jgi:hypothetical protein
VLQLGAGAGVAALAAPLATASPRADGAFLEKPYLQLGDRSALSDPESLSLIWHTEDVASAWSVDVRLEGSDTWIAAADPESTRVMVEGIPPHRVYRAQLGGLLPGGGFTYRVVKDGQVAFTAGGRARKSSGQSWRAIVMGDCGTANSAQREVAFQVQRHDPDFVLIPGDVVYENGRVQEWRSNYFPIYNADEADAGVGAPLTRSTMFLGGLGQHDTGQALDAFPDGLAFYMYWSLPLNGPPLAAGGPNTFPLGGLPARQQATLAATAGRYPRMANYSFDFGNAHWTVLDTWNPHVDWNDAGLRRWLADDLAAAQGATWRFVSSYLPPFNSSTAYPHTQKMRVVVDLLEEAGVDIVFSGYAHSYQRTYPLRFKASPPPPTGPVKDPGTEVPGTFEFDRQFDGRDQTRPRGIIYLVTGGGGGMNLHSPEQTNNPATWQPYTMKYVADVHHFTLLETCGLEAGDRTLTCRQISRAGVELDRFVITR